MKTLLVDNYDSFTFNLFQLLAEVNGIEPTVVKNDDSAWVTLNLDEFDSVVISPGPGRPDRTNDIGRSAQVIQNASLPILGVCLGHQAICHYYGATVGLAPLPMHGRVNEVNHDGDPLFSKIPSPFNVVRYHSLAATNLPNNLRPIAFASDGVLMAVKHETRPLWGVQYHPESILTEYGHQILENFRHLAKEWNTKMGRRVVTTNVKPVVSTAQSTNNSSPKHPFEVHWRKLDYWVDPAVIFKTQFSHADTSFWLDSANIIPGLSRFSFMGDNSGPHAEVITYNTKQGFVQRKVGDQISVVEQNVFTYLSEQLHNRGIKKQDLPFSFGLGYVGYLGYELKADCEGGMTHEASTPDSSLLFSDRLIAFDHQTSSMYLLGLTSQTDSEETIEHWFDEMQVALALLQAEGILDSNAKTDLRDIDDYNDACPETFAMRHSREQYLDLIAMCQEELRNGESYEICLTNMIHSAPLEDPLETYLLLRHANPAPFASYFRFPDFSILSASPERFLSIDANGRVEAKPIKGTTRRGKTTKEDQSLKRGLRSEERFQAENLMIVDLLRNDLGRVCEIGTVIVPKLFDVESYTTVHQLVSTIEGQLRTDCSAVDCLRLAFPGGSMTGAPKIRTMNIIDRLENGPRGIYSGAIGYFSLSGAADWSIVIRTIVNTVEGASVGVGGGITALSDAVAEFEETMLKAEALCKVLPQMTDMGHQPAPLSAPI